jgi:hypothetical protein
VPFQKLTFRPGINTQISATANEGGWSGGGLVRFRDGVVEKWAGWTPATGYRLTGVPRSALAWQQLDGNFDVAFGTHSRLMLLQGGALYDLTPIGRTVTLTNPLSTNVAQVGVVTVHDVGHGATTGDGVYLSGMITIDGVAPLNGLGAVFSVLDADHWWLLSGMPVTSTVASGGGTITFNYEITSGLSDTIASNGVGVGAVGVGTVGTPRPSTNLTLRIWSLASFGEILLASPSGGSLYAWAPSSGVASPAAIVTNSTPANGPPLVIASMLMGMPERHLILLGSSQLNSTSGFDPLLIRFSDVEDYTTYLATATNSAGSFRLEGGTRLVGGLGVSGQIMVWSDLCLFSMRFVGAPYFYSFNRIGSNCGMIGPNAATYYGGAVYWMGQAAFFQYTGGAPQPIPCAIYQAVFGNMAAQQGYKTYCAANQQTDEILWFYQSAAGGEVDSYVSYHTVLGVWTFGSLPRTTWIATPTGIPPIATNPDGTIYYQETGVDRVELNGAIIAGGPESVRTWPLPADALSGYFDIGDGTQFMAINRVIPDFVYQTGTVYLTVYTTDYPNTAPRVLGPFALTPGTDIQTIRARGRQIAFKFACSDIGAHFRLGAVRINIITDGGR